MGRDSLSDYVNGQWHSLDRVMNLINGMTSEEDITQDQMRRRIYGAVASLRPEIKNGKV